MGCCFSGSFLVIFRYTVSEIKRREEILSFRLLGMINYSEKRSLSRLIKLGIREEGCLSCGSTGCEI